MTTSKYYSYLLVTSDPYLEPEVKGHRLIKTKNAYELAMQRLNSKVWPLFKTTSNRNSINENDKLLFYIAGGSENARKIIASANVYKIRAANDSDHEIDAPYKTSIPYTILELSNINILKLSVSIKDVISNLSICPANPKFYGTRLHGGCTGLTEQDYNLIIGHGI